MQNLLSSPRARRCHRARGGKLDLCENWPKCLSCYDTTCFHCYTDSGDVTVVLKEMPRRHCLLIFLAISPVLCTSSVAWFVYDLEVDSFFGGSCAPGARIVSGVVPHGGHCVSTNVSLPLGVVVRLSYAGTCSADGASVSEAKICIGSKNCSAGCTSSSSLTSGSCLLSAPSLNLTSSRFVCKAGVTTAAYDAVVAIICIGSIGLATVIAWLVRLRCAPLRRAYLACSSSYDARTRVRDLVRARTREAPVVADKTAVQEELSVGLLRSTSINCDGATPAS